MFSLLLLSLFFLGLEASFFFTDAVESIPQMNYPYEIGTFPAWPVNRTCEIITGGQKSNDYQNGRKNLTKFEILDLASQITNFFYGYDGKNCISGADLGQGGVPGNGPGPKEWGPWAYQSCSETLHKFSGNFLLFSFSLFC